MNIKVTISSLFVILFVLATANLSEAFATVAVTSSSDANTLAGALTGSGIAIISTPTFDGGSACAGTFTGGGSAGIGIPSGIILTSGLATNSLGPNNSDSLSAATGSGSDANLDTLVIGSSTFDKCVLEFDFTTTTGDLFFKYVFASEEYNEYANTAFNDVFAFYLDGTNIAILPSPPALANTPVAINNVNGGNPFGTNNAQNPSLFNNNDLDDGGPFFDIQYDGFTKVFTAQKLGLTEGTHHIKLAIADTNDAVFDSAVFIQEGSFTGTPPPPAIPTTVILDPITDPYTDDKFTVTGKLIDDNTGRGVPGKLVKFDGDGAVADLLDATTSGFTVNNPCVGECTPTIVIDNSAGDKILRLNNLATIDFPSNPPQVILSLKGMGTETFTALVTTLGTPTSFSAQGVGQGPDTGSLTLTDGDGISSIQITSLSSGTAGITGVEAFNSQLVRYIGEEFSDEVSGPSPQSFAEGSFFSKGTAQSTVADGLSVNAHFDGDESYEASATETCVGEECIQTTNIQTYNVHYATGGGFGGAEAFVSTNGGGFTNIDTCTDTDGDALCDTWEDAGKIGAGADEILLPGSNKYKKNIYVEVDFMPGRNPFVNGANNDGIDDVITAFANAPVTNTYSGGSSSNGVILTVEQGTQITETNPTLNVWSDALADSSGACTDFDCLKKYYFGSSGDSAAKKSNKALAYHYFIFANGLPGGASGVAEIGANDGVVALAGYSGTRQQIAGTFMHELGHNLNLDHGGPANVNYQDRSINCKPNHDSVMSYSRQLPNLLTYPGEWVLDYSDGGLSPTNGNPGASLKESGGTGGNIKEALGNLYNNDNAIRPGTDPIPWIIWGTPNIGGVELGVSPATSAIPADSFKKQQAIVAGGAAANIDWNGDGGIQAGVNKARDLNGFGFFGCESGTLSSTAFKNYNEWAELLYNFRGVPGGTYDAQRPLDNPYVAAVPDIDTVIDDQLQLFSASHNALFPWKADSSLTLKKGLPIPIGVRMFDGGGVSLVKADGSVSYQLFKSGSSTVISSGSLVYDKFVTKSWVGLVKAPSTTGTYFIKLTFTNPQGAIVTKDITPNTNPVYTNTGNQMSLKVVVT